MQEVTLHQSYAVHPSHLQSNARVGTDDDVYAKIAMHQVAIASCSKTTSSRHYGESTNTPARALDTSKPANIYDSLIRTPSKPVNIFASLLRTESGQDAEISAPSLTRRNSSSNQFHDVLGTLI